MDATFRKIAEKAGADGSETQWERQSFGTEMEIEQGEPRLTMIGFQRKGALFFLSLLMDRLVAAGQGLNVTW